jgi:hypothetical protein
LIRVIQTLEALCCTVAYGIPKVVGKFSRQVVTYGIKCSRHIGFELINDRLDNIGRHADASGALDKVPGHNVMEAIVPTVANGHGEFHVITTYPTGIKEVLR